MPLPHGSVFQFYEGPNQSDFTEATGININLPRSQLLENDQYLESLILAALPDYAAGDPLDILRVNAAGNGFNFDPSPATDSTSTLARRDANGNVSFAPAAANFDVVTRAQAEAAMGTGSGGISWSGPDLVDEASNLVSAQDSGSTLPSAMVAMSPTALALVDPGYGALVRVEKVAGVWERVGDTYPSGESPSYPALAALSSTRVAYIDVTNNSLVMYEWDPNAGASGQWAPVGNPRVISVFRPYLTALSPTRVVMADNTDGLSIYEFDGTNWSRIGAVYSTIDQNPSVVALSPTRVAVTSLNPRSLFTLDFDGTDWTQVGDTLTIPFSIDMRNLTSLNPTDIVSCGPSHSHLAVYRFNEVEWQKVNPGVTMYPSENVFRSTLITAIGSRDVMFLDTVDGTLRNLRFRPSLGDPDLLD